MEKKISMSLQEARFILVHKNGKGPVTDFKGDDWKEKTIDYTNANKSLEKYNIGLVCGHDNIICIDCDSLELAQACEGLLPETYKEQTCSNGYHYIYRLKELFEDFDIKDVDWNGKHLGEIRNQDSYVVIYPSKARNKVTNELTDYRILSDVDKLAVITKEQVQEVMSQFMSEEKIKTSPGKISQELLERINQDAELKQLFETELKKGERSEAEQQLVDKLVSRDFNKKEIFSIMGSSKIGKWNEKPISYRELTYNNGVQYVTTQKATADLKPLQVMNLRDFEKYKESKDYIIQDLFYPGENGMFYSPSGHFKSLLSLYLACCIVTGRPYLDKFKVKSGPVLILSAENSIKTDKQRLFMILRGLHSRKKDIPLHVLPRSACEDILNPNFRARIEKFIIEKKIKVVFLDTINPLTPEIDDNKGKDVTNVFNHFLKPLCDNHHISIYFLHHTDKGERNFLGSIKWRANCDSVWRIDRKELENKFKVYNEKGRGGEEDVLEVEITFDNKKEIRFKFLSSGPAQRFTKRKKMNQQEFFLMKLNELVKDKKTKRAAIAAIFTKHKIGFKRATLDRAIKEWRGEK